MLTSPLLQRAASALSEPQPSHTINLWLGAGGTPSFFAVGPLSHSGFSRGLSVLPSLDFSSLGLTPKPYFAAQFLHMWPLLWVVTSLWFPNFASLFQNLLGTPASQT